MLSTEAKLSVLRKSTVQLEKLLDEHAHELSEELCELIEDELDKRAHDEPMSDSPSLQDTFGEMPSYAS